MAVIAEAQLWQDPDHDQDQQKHETQEIATALYLFMPMPDNYQAILVARAALWV